MGRTMFECVLLLTKIGYCQAWHQVESFTKSRAMGLDFNVDIEEGGTHNRTIKPAVAQHQQSHPALLFVVADGRK